LKCISELARLLCGKADWEPRFHSFKGSFSKACSILFLIAGIELGALTFFLAYTIGEWPWSDELDFRPNVEEVVNTLNDMELVSRQGRPLTHTHEVSERFISNARLRSSTNKSIAESMLQMRFFEEFWGIDVHHADTLALGYVSDDEAQRLLTYLKREEPERATVWEELIAYSKKGPMARARSDNDYASPVAVSREGGPFRLNVSESKLKSAFALKLREETLRRAELRLAELEEATGISLYRPVTRI
jgi:hypothetical protein